MSNTDIKAAPVDTGDARELLKEYEQELFQRWSGPLRHDQTEAPAASTGLVPPDGLFLLARVNGSPAGCVGIRALSPGVGEIKRMFVRPAFRGRGVGRSLLTAVEAEARKLGHTRLRLDTMEELIEARGLYASSGYIEIAPYTTNPYIRHWLEKTL
ncbi:GNAT family N-acetyltransferase [Streptomyces massasporeus]|uniref:GNAT family N-acetyltransferase n=1 Tax=Streptomyces massasporeus TaxID=67324 RepID=UPI00340ADAC5